MGSQYLNDKVADDDLLERPALSRANLIWCGLFWIALLLVELVPAVYVEWLRGEIITFPTVLLRSSTYIYWFGASLLIQIWLHRYPLRQTKNFTYHVILASGLSGLYTFWASWNVFLFNLPGFEEITFAEVFVQRFIGMILGEMVIYAVIAGAWTLANRRRGSAQFAGSLALKQDGELRKLAARDIVWLESMENYVVVHTQFEKLVHRATLKATLAALGKAFIRVHRSAAVNKDYIQAVRSASNEILMNSGDIVAVGRRRMPEVTRLYLASENPS